MKLDSVEGLDSESLFLNSTLVNLFREVLSVTDSTNLFLSSTSNLDSNATAANEKTSWDPVMINDTLELEEMAGDEYIFDRLYVRVIFIILYTIVFCFCFFGNLMVILVVTLHWRMRNITKFCLGNLAFADLCVGVFCVYQNLSTYLINSWVLGEFLCKMYQFINALSHTASILILVVICVERYLAIIYPFLCKRLLTIKRLRFIIVGVWLASAIYCSPRLYYIVTFRVFRMDGGTEIICIAQRTKYDSRTFDMIHIFLLFLLPLVVMSILYTRVGITLWRSSKNNLPWSTGAASNNTESENLSRSSSGTVCEDIPTASRTFSVRLSTLRKSSRNHANSSRRDRKDVEELQNSNINSSGNSSSHGHGHGHGHGPPKHSSFKDIILHSSNASNHVNSSTSSYRVTVENKCYVVGPNPNEVQITDMSSSPLPSGDTASETEFNDNLSDNHPSSDHRSGNHLHVTPHQLPSSLLLTADGSTKRSHSSCSSSRSPSMSHGGSFRFRRDASTRCSKRIRCTTPGGTTTPTASGVTKCSQAKNLRGGKAALKSRQTVVKMLIVIVATFAVCNFPFHLRKMFQYWWPNYDNGSAFSTLITPLTHLTMYANSAINPIIYAFMSKVFRSSFRDLLRCRFKKPFQVEGHTFQGGSTC